MTLLEAIVYLVIGYCIAQGLCSLGANIGKGIIEGMAKIADAIRRKEE